MSPQTALNWYATRLHYTDDLAPVVPGEPVRGQTGMALCSTEGNPVHVHDKVALDWYAMKYGCMPKKTRAVPLCKRCERKLAQRDGTP